MHGNEKTLVDNSRCNPRVVAYTHARAHTHTPATAAAAACAVDESRKAEGKNGCRVDWMARARGGDSAAAHGGSGGR